SLPRPAGRAKPNKWVVAIAVTFGTLMGTIDTSIINVAVPHLKGTFSATTEEITWISTGYIVASVIIMPLTAWLGSLFGRKRIYITGLVLFLVGSFFCGAASSLFTLVIWRILQGVGAGALQPTEQAILRETFPPEEQGTAMALYGLAIMLGPAVGPTLGGYLVDNYSWRWIFYINIPVGMIGLFMVWTFVEDPPYLEKFKGKIDSIGLILLIVGLGALQTLLERGEEHDWFADTFNVWLAIFAVCSLAMWVAHELEIPNPQVNLRLLKDRTFASGSLISACLMSVLFASMFLLPLYMQELLRYDATQSGLRLMPRTLVMFLVMPLAGRMYGKVDSRLLVAIGLFFGGVATWMMGHFSLYTDTWHILAPQLVQGFAMPLIFIPLSTLALANVPRPQMGQATGLYNLIRQLGGSFGVAAFAAMLTRYIGQSRVQLTPHIAMGDPKIYSMVQGMTANFVARGADAATAHGQALAAIDGMVQGQAAMLGFDRAFTLGAILFWAIIPLVLLLKLPDAPVKGEAEHAAVEI
ncbi:MAG TPA: DHA2 family efflux MFS transporter permease subunit, partial [bacterium]|nr:DHA2 family efflux MFS transporter permease subunit [bacterium]